MIFRLPDSPRARRPSHEKALLSRGRRGGPPREPLLPAAILPFALSPVKPSGCKLMSVSFRGAANLKRDLGTIPDRGAQRSPRLDEASEHRIFGIYLPCFGPVRFPIRVVSSRSLAKFTVV
jgi:hypothetical protein